MLSQRRAELFKYADNRKFSSEPDVVKSTRDAVAKSSSQSLVRLSTTRILSHYMTSFLVQTMKELGIAMDF